MDMCSFVKVNTHLKSSGAQNHRCVVAGFVKTGTICYADGLFTLFCHRPLFILNCSASEIFFREIRAADQSGGPPEDFRISG